MRPSTRLATAALAALACVAAPSRYDRAVSAQEKPAAGRPSVTAPLAPARRSSLRHALQDGLFDIGHLFPRGWYGPQADGDHGRRLHGPLERGRVRGLPVDRRALSDLFRVR